MACSRREFVQQKAGGLGLTATTLVASAASARVIDAGAARAPVRAILFDAFPVFDPRPVAALAEAEFPGHRADLAALWRRRQFEYNWLRAIARDSVDFGFLSNLTPHMLDSAIRGSNLLEMFEHMLSTDRARTYKPDSRAYQLGIDAFQLPCEQILFAAFAGYRHERRVAMPKTSRTRPSTAWRPD